AELKADILVLGAGMVGVGAALHLQRRGRDVILVDRHSLAGEETSFGNGGLIECASVFPYMFPRDFGQILQYALNRSSQVRYQIADLPTFLPWVVRYFLASSPKRTRHSAMAELPLIRRSLIEHEALMAEAAVPELLRRTGWLKLFRSDATLSNAVREFQRAQQYGVAGEVLDSKAIAAGEPNLSGEFAGAIYLPAPGFVPDPGGLAKAYAALFQRKGDAFLWAMPGRSNKTPADGVSPDPVVRRSRAKPWWRWARGPTWCFVRLDIPSRLPSSAATTCIWRRAAMRCSIIPCSTRILATCLRR